MTGEMWLVLGILAAAIYLFITEKFRVDVVALSVVVFLMITGVLTTGEALAGFSNSAVLTIAALFVVGGAVMQTGLATLIGRRILQVAGTNQTRLTVILMIAVALLSGFMSDTGTVAVLLPAVIILAKNANVNPSRLLIPLSYGALLGGAMTLIGTPPNIIASDILAEAGMTPFNFFSYTPMGLILLGIGIVFMAVFGSKLLPNRAIVRESEKVRTPEEIVEIYRLDDDLFRLRIRRGSPLIGKNVFTSEMRQKFDVTILKIMRPPEKRPQLSLTNPQRRQAAELKDTPLTPDENTTFELDDILIVKGSAEDVSHAAASLSLGVLPKKPKDGKALINREVGVAEVLLPPRSSLLGKTLVELRFGSRFQLTVLAIQRPGVQEKLDLHTTPLQFGDTLLVQGTWQNILALKKFRNDFIVIGQPESMMGAPNQEKAVVALVILLGMLVLMIGEVLSTAVAAMLAGLLMVIFGCLTMDEAYRAIDWKSIVLIAGMLPMSTALEKVGLVDAAATGLVSILGNFDPRIALAGLFLATSLFTQVLSNTATTVIIAPIALAAAQNLGVAPHAFLMGVAVAASMAFASPVASPTNTLVMGAGNYRFSDYIKVGIPLILLMLVAVTFILPLIFPF
ncbi:MAG: SLC13 family permease [Candidatus Promineifilaceae bacterium]